MDLSSRLESQHQSLISLGLTSADLQVAPSVVPTVFSCLLDLLNTEPIGTLRMLSAQFPLETSIRRNCTPYCLVK
jgi:hypothetical protein